MRKKRENVQNPAPYEQMREVLAMVMKAVPQLSVLRASYFIGNQRQVTAKVRAIFEEGISSQYADLLAAWVNLYRAEFNIELDLTAIRIPEQREGFGWLIVVAPGVTIEMVLAACKKRFSVYRWNDKNLDEFTDSVRSAKDGPYAVWVRSRVEADEEYKNKSYNDLQKANIPGITLLERLLLELKYFIETGGHLDISNVTLCSGSLYRVGHVACVRWRAGGVKLYVYWYFRVAADDGLRGREVVPVP